MKLVFDSPVRTNRLGHFRRREVARGNVVALLHAGRLALTWRIESILAINALEAPGESFQIRFHSHQVSGDLSQGNGHRLDEVVTVVKQRRQFLSFEDVLAVVEIESAAG